MDGIANQRQGITVVKLEGSLDLGAAEDARTLLLNAIANGPVLVDLGGTKCIDSAGVACLLESLQSATQSSKPFALAGLSPDVVRVLEIARLDRVFQIHQSVEDGVAEMAST